MDRIDLILIPLIKVVVVFVSLVAVVPLLIVFERKIIGWIQQRPGPNRLYSWGLIQGLVDGIKLLLKEDFIPPGCDRAMFILAPILSLAPAFLAISIVPLGPSFELVTGEVTRVISLGVTDLPVGILFYFAVTSIGVYGIVLAGWSSNSKYALLGGIRASAQLISYELMLGLSLVGVLMFVGSLNMRDLVASQEGGLLNWHVVCQPVGFLLFLIGGFAETNRLPFDLAEGESELGAGFHTEFSSMKFAMFFLAEYVNIVTFAAIMTTLFLGGYHSPVPIPFIIAPVQGLADAVLGAGTAPGLGAGLVGMGIFTIKVAMIFFFFVWVRGTLPRLRYDQLMDFGWKALLILAIANLIVSAGVLAFIANDTLARIVLCAAGIAMIFGADRVAIQARDRVLTHAG